MDRGPGLTKLQRQRIRWYVNHQLAAGLEPKQMVQLIHDMYLTSGGCRAYALAYYGAVYTAEPLELARVRDSRS